MANVKKGTGLGYSGIISLINSLNIDYITINGSSVTIDNHVTLSFGINAVYLSVDGGSSTRISRVSESCTVVITYSDKLFSLNVVDNSGRAYAVIYEKIGDDCYYGWNGNVDNWSAYHGFYSIEEITITNIATSESYTHSARLNYSCQLGIVDYTDDCFFKAGYRDIPEPNFIACSTLVANQIVTFEGVNYYSIGTNTLIEYNEV